MKLIFDHTRGFGKMTEQVFFYAPYGAFFDSGEYENALEQGWLPANQTLWYQSRSTRIKISNYTPNRTTKKIAKKINFFPNVLLTQNQKNIFESIYKKYTTKKNFKSNFFIEEMIANSNGQIYYTYENNIIAFTFFKFIGKNLIAIEFGWDYEMPSLSMGNVNIYYLWRLCHFKKINYLYLGAGYESSCAYKCNYDGFEWWTGHGWSTDKEQYKQLCLADDKVMLNNYKFSI